MTKIKDTFSLGAVSLADQLVVSGTSFLTMFLVAKTCSKADVGVFALAWTIIGFLRTIQERIIAAPYLAFAYRPGYQRPSFRGSSIIHQACLAGIATSVLILFAVGSLAFDQGDRQWKLLLSLSIALPFTLFRDQMRAISSAGFQFAGQLALDVVISALQIGGIIALGFAHHFTLAWVNVVLGVACIPPIALWFYSIRGSVRFDSEAAWSDWKSNWAYSKWLLAARTFGVGGYLTVPWLVSYFLGTASTGAFAVCNTLVGISLVCVTGANNMFQPKTVRELQQQGIAAMLRTILETVIIILSALVIISCGFCFLGNWALGLIYGKSYEEYGFLAFLLSLSSLAVSPSIIFGNGLAALGNSREYFWGEFYCFVFSIGGALVMIPLFGLNGAAYALILGGLAASTVTGLTLLRGVYRYRRETLTPNPPPVSLNPMDAGHV